MSSTWEIYILENLKRLQHNPEELHTLLHGKDQNIRHMFLYTREPIKTTGAIQGNQSEILFQCRRTNVPILVNQSETLYSYSREPIGNTVQYSFSRETLLLL